MCGRNALFYLRTGVVTGSAQRRRPPRPASESQLSVWCSAGPHAGVGGTQGQRGPPSASLGEAGQGAVRGDTLQLCVSTDRRACREAPEAAWGESGLPLHPADFRRDSRPTDRQPWGGRGRPAPPSPLAPVPTSCSPPPGKAPDIWALS